MFTVFQTCSPPVPSATWSMARYQLLSIQKQKRCFIVFQFCFLLSQVLSYIRVVRWKFDSDQPLGFATWSGSVRKWSARQLLDAPLHGLMDLKWLNTFKKIPFLVNIHNLHSICIFVICISYYSLFHSFCPKCVKGHGWQLKLLLRWYYKINEVDESSS